MKQAEDAHLIESYSEAADLCTLALGIYSDNVEALILRVRANLRLKGKILFSTICLSKLFIYILTKHHLFFFS